MALKLKRGPLGLYQLPPFGVQCLWVLLYLQIPALRHRGTPPCSPRVLSCGLPDTTPQPPSPPARPHHDTTLSTFLRPPPRLLPVPSPPLPPFPPSSFSATMTFFDERRKACLHRMGVGAAMGAGVGGAAGLLFGAAESRRYAIPTSQVRVAAGGGFLYGIFLGEGSAEVVEGGRERRGTGAGG